MFDRLGVSFNNDCEIGPCTRENVKYTVFSRENN